MSMYIDMYISIYINTCISISIRVDILGSPNRWKLIVTVTYAFTSSCVPYTYLSYNFLPSVSHYLSNFIIFHYISLLLRTPSPLQYFQSFIFSSFQSFHLFIYSPFQAVMRLYRKFEFMRHSSILREEVFNKSISLRIQN